LVGNCGEMIDKLPLEVGWKGRFQKIGTRMDVSEI